MKHNQDEKIPIIVDSREQTPFFMHDLYNDRITKTTKALKAGDYSIAGFEDVVAIERKSLGDLYHSFTHERPRFEREIQRLSDYEFSAVVIEASYNEISNPAEHRRFWQSNANPASIVQSILSWSVKYPTKWFWLKDRQNAEAVCFDLLRHFWRQQAEKTPSNK